MANPSVVGPSPIPAKLARWVKDWSSDDMPLGGYEIVNLEPYISADSVEATDLYNREERVRVFQGQPPSPIRTNALAMNVDHIRAACARSRIVIAAWGQYEDFVYSSRVKEVLDGMRKRNVFCLGTVNKYKGRGVAPAHPQRLHDPMLTVYQVASDSP